MRFAFSWSDHSRIILGSVAHCGNATSTIFPKYLSDLGVQFCVAGAVFDEVQVSLLWQVQHLVKFMCDVSWQVQHSVKFMCHFWWQAQYLVKFMCHFSWQVQHLVKFMCHFLWRLQHLVKFMCHFSWQVQYLVKCGMIAGAGNVVIFKNLLLGSAKRSLGGAAGCGLRFHGRIILGSFSDRTLWKCDFNHFP